MPKMNEDELIRPPKTKPYYNLVSGFRFDVDVERNILLHFIESKGLSEECDKFIDENFPREDEEDEDY